MLALLEGQRCELLHNILCPLKLLAFEGEQAGILVEGRQASTIGVEDLIIVICKGLHAVKVVNSSMSTPAFVESGSLQRWCTIAH